MGFVTALSAAVLFSLACNLDTVILAMGYTIKGIHISVLGGMVLAAVTTLVTWLSLVLGVVTAGLFSPAISSLLGGVVLVGIGLWLLLDYLRRMGRTETEDAPDGSRGIWGYVSLAAALAVNNAGVGVAAGMAGLCISAATLCNFLVTLAALPLGRWLGVRVAGRFLGKFALPISGLLLVVLGLWEAIA